MFCVEFNYSACRNGDCDQPHWCAICFQFGHNAREHRMQPLSSPTLQETIYFFGGWSNPQFMMYHNLWIERAMGTSEDVQKKWNLDRWNGHFHGHTSTRHCLLAISLLFNSILWSLHFWVLYSHNPVLQATWVWVCICTCLCVCVCVCVCVLWALISFISGNILCIIRQLLDWTENGTII